ncbi:MAG: YicC family protein [Bacteroidetes bacterium]|nr:YicC family protein [Bacteroidota bacterium]MBS1683140.1 YicC family protein [Bacteroidota bacterium]
MLYSMTGFGKAQVAFKNKTIIAEVRSLNSQKGLDLSLKFTTQFREQEYNLRNLISEKLQRGKVDVYVTIEKEDHTPEVLLNKRVIKAYYQELRQIADEVGAPSADLLSTILQLPEIAASAAEESDEEEWKAIEGAIMKALDGLNGFRADEGKILAEDMLQRIALIDKYAQEVRSMDKERVSEIKARLETSVEAAVGKDKIDPNRLEQELVYYIEKLDITEELTRLKAHCEYYREVMAGKDDMKGRKLNFISQEIGREINTLGSKASHAPIQKLVVNMKDELEKIKEQINNIL